VKLSRSVFGSLSLLVIVSGFVLRPAFVLAQSSAESSMVLAEGDKVKTSDRDSPEVRIGFRIAPVRLTFRAADRELVGRGSYIVNAQGACNDCHTNPNFVEGRNPFMGEPEKVNKANYLAGGASFGPFVSRNLTPDANGRPAGMTWVEFNHVMTTGIDLKHLHPQISPFLQVMPWPVYGKMRQQDLRAIYAYLKAIPSASPAADASAATTEP
jgi:hypothetical protein